MCVHGYIQSCMCIGTHMWISNKIVQSMFKSYDAKSQKIWHGPTVSF